MRLERALGVELSRRCDLGVAQNIFCLFLFFVFLCRSRVKRERHRNIQLNFNTVFRQHLRLLRARLFAKIKRRRHRFAAMRKHKTRPRRARIPPALLQQHRAKTIHQNHALAFALQLFRVPHHLTIAHKHNRSMPTRDVTEHAIHRLDTFLHRAHRQNKLRSQRQRECQRHAKRQHIHYEGHDVRRRPPPIQPKIQAQKKHGWHADLEPRLLIKRQLLRGIVHRQRFYFKSWREGNRPQIHFADPVSVFVHHARRQSVITGRRVQPPRIDHDLILHPTRRRTSPIHRLAV